MAKVYSLAPFGRRREKLSTRQSPLNRRILRPARGAANLDATAAPDDSCGNDGNEASMSEESAQARARRWRWITLAELLAVAGVVISALALYDSHNARTQEQSERAAAQGKEVVKVDRLTLVGTAEKEGRSLKLEPAVAGQVIQSQTIRFPAALGVSAAQTTGDPRLEAEWFADGLKKARRAAGEKDESVGDERLPIAIETRYLVGGVIRTDRAIYDLGYTISGQFLGGSSVKLRGLALVERPAGDVAAMLDRRWAAAHRSAKKNG
jgi:hypothetical protein